MRRRVLEPRSHDWQPTSSLPVSAFLSAIVKTGAIAAVVLNRR
jgi:hypothetical protein